MLLLLLLSLLLLSLSVSLSLFLFFPLQEADLRYLVVDIWSSQSALSSWEDLYDLVMVRWDKDDEWSPWNCILLTKDEAKAHSQIDDLDKVRI